MSAEAFRKNVIQFERALKEAGDTVEAELTHEFEDGHYFRTMQLKRGQLIVGAIHRFEHVCFISKGYVSIFDEDGRVDAWAPYAFIAKPGTKRVIIAHLDTTWTNIHKTDLTDIAEIERTLVTDSYDALEYKEQAWLSS